MQIITLAPGITLRCFPDRRFKQGAMSLQFVRPMRREEAAMNALLPSVLLRGTKNHSDLRAITQKLDELYGAAVSPLVRRIGDYQTKGVGRWQPFGKGNGVFDTEDSATVFFRFEGGKTMMAEIAWAINGNESATTTIYGSKAGCTFEPLTIYGEDEEGYLSTEKPEVVGVTYFVEEIRHFVDCLNTGKTPISPIEDAVTVQRMLDGIYASAEKHEEVKI